MTRVWLGIDAGSVSVNLAVLDASERLLHRAYLRTRGQPVHAVGEALAAAAAALPADAVVAGVGTTGSGRQLIALVFGADEVKNEITAHAVAALALFPDARTVIEIGGQDSKIILLSDGVVSDFAMNTVCAAGTGSFLDQQAARLGYPIEAFGRIALDATRPTRIAGRCGVFAESDMIHKQQAGYALPDIVAGLCEALARNFLTNVGRGKRIEERILFQGGVAANPGLVAAFERVLERPVTVPAHHDIMGAVGAALVARRAAGGQPTRFRGFGAARAELATRTFECDRCANLCEVVEVLRNGEADGRIGGRCGRYDCP